MTDIELEQLERVARDVTPEMIAAAWKVFRRSEGWASVGPGPGFKEAIQAAIDARHSAKPLMIQWREPTRPAFTDTGEAPEHKSLWESLTPEQQEAAISYDGPEVLGNPYIKEDNE